MTVSCKRVFTIFSLLGKTGIKLQNMLFVSSLYKETEEFFPLLSTEPDDLFCASQNCCESLI